ncbi:tyrosine-protein kinase receptor torso [Anopheles gambiae]|uniref:tyrosine-protein kinase receptor torso n=1 Tax=Anopheles gambiae TaxID=7165 RepID=UPI002AC9C115|nr:tyrosine-protein kinase receptor torso [Anopheles gambiae]XP_061502653.1 tyrosine-protein kinase receptor torso [Anopheles gambiae]XP_061502654.1 tyrosine-protein kinase receptor torso [Anopheles gambiae]XP_061502656.1 tyrosine-protein kinase receptor torso [Anopheles gambiae]XP_061502657.1 tyrosine-protein kinase receptor torso [Anopheles gambiae]XP_061502658.1 tyrosine-protein kinase receptor torso [Anopheles gambiae]XP_061502659.1 tyrosine-protein kinase receptor torso [Anopheles gambia
MHVIVLKYVQVLCITIFFSNNINCDKLLLHNEQEDQELYRIGACTAACMAGTEPGGPVDRNATGTTVPSAEELKTIGYCYKRCSEDTRPLSAWRPLVQRQDPSLRINLICRDSTNLIIEIKPTALEAGGGVGGNHHHQDSKLTPKLSAPGGNQNQLNALRDRSASAESLESAAPARSRRAIGADGPLSAGQLTERQKASSGTRTNLLQPTAGKIDGPTLHGSVDASADEDDEADNVAVKVQPDREHYQRALAAEQDRTRPPVPIYLVKVQDSEQELGDRIVYMSNASLVKIENLAPNRRYNVTATMLTSEYEYYYVEKHQYRTLPHDYMPGIVTDIMVERFETNARDSRLVDAVISWTPAKDRTCHYEIVCHASYSPDFLLKPIDVQQPEVLYKYTIKALKLSANYMIAVRSKNTQNAMRESQLHWQSFHTPSCTNHTNGTQVCAPEPITNVRVTQVPLYGDHYQLNISWDRPTIAPDSYVVKVFDLHNPETEEPGNSVTKNLTGDAVGVLIESFEMFGPHFEVLVAAYSRVGVSSENTIKALQIGRVSSESWIRTKLVFIILTPVLMIGLLKISISLICRRRAKLKRYEERCEYFKELEQKAPVDPSTEFEPTSKQMQDLLATSHPFSPDLIAPINDELEIEMEHIKLHDMLGEGAFGLVRKGVLQRSGDDGEPAQPVAVKMLKECPRVEDILEFRREMEVMKSVGTHPHIVGIVGHCTKNVRKMMLLTEYCGRGNLLNYLRLQWQRLLRQNRTTGTRSIGGTSGTNITATLPSPPPPPPPPPTRSLEMADHECLTPSLDNNKMPENVFNFDTSFVNDKKSLTYKNISDHRQTLLGVAFGLAGGSDGSSASRSPQIIENKLYPLFSDESDGDETAQLTHCTNACKNAVEIVEGTWEVGEDVKGSVRIKPCSCHGAPVDSTLTNNTVENRWYQSCSPQSEEEEDPLPNSGQLLEFSRQIALGMEFLARNKVVHRDLAARNVLVCDSNTVKIADFGLSRDIYQENLYRKTSNGKLPIKWLALESMTHQVYTSQSDVWSYGILLYEICTLGGSPYPAISTNRLLRYLESGYRMERPKSCSELLYDLMYSCWNLHPGERPTFSKIVHTVEQLQARDIANDPVVIDLSAIVDSHCTKNTTEENSYLKPVEY